MAAEQLIKRQMSYLVHAAVDSAYLREFKADQNQHAPAEKVFFPSVLR